MSQQPSFITLTPQEFEMEVEKLLREMGADLSQFQVKRLEKIEGLDGEYEIDVSVRFEALGASFLVLAECKHYKSSVKREVVQILKDKLHSLGAQKGMVFSTAPFQRGAINYAKAHGIALIQVADGGSSYMTKSAGPPPPLPPWVPAYVGWMVTPSEFGPNEGSETDIRYGTNRLICSSNSHLLGEWIRGE